MAEYIEREKAIERIQPRVKPQTVYGEGYLQAIEHATDILTLLPAADVQPVRHGKWIDDKTCSNCGFDILYNYGISGTKYCPDCGADMRGDPDV